MKKTYSKKYLPLIIGIACAVGVLIGSLLNFPKNTPKLFSSNTNKQKLENLIDYINYDYVDKVNTDSIVEVAISSILKNLDPHSTYIPQKELEEITENMDGDFVGIGLRFFTLGDTVSVIHTLEDGPGKKAGILPGDRLLYANNVPLFGKNMTSDALKNILRGKVNSKINLKVERRGYPDLLDIKVSREHIPLKSVDAGFMLNSKLGYVKINRFSKTTHTEFKKATAKLKEKGASELVLDLRDNGGGYLKEAIAVADEFLEKEKLILITQDNKNNTKYTHATGQGELVDIPVYVLINENSASASEVVAGALQDNDIGTIIGRRSYGKGLVQREMDLGDGSAVRLTVARYYTPTGRSIQRPYKGENGKDYMDYHHRRYVNGELQNKDSIHVNQALRYITPHGKVVYGGGGIIPDIFVGKNINFKRESLDYMLKGGMMDRYIFEVMDKDRPFYNSLTQEDLETQINFSGEILEGFIDYLQSFKLDYGTRSYKSVIAEYLKATMADQLFGKEAYYQILLDKDPMILRVLSLDLTEEAR